MGKAATKYDYVIIGSGFGGSVSAYRLAQKGYRVLVVERGRRFTETDFSEGTSSPPRWVWNPKLGMRGIWNITFLRHVTIMSGAGVGGGSLVYGATLPTPKKSFFESGSWAGLRDWQQALAPHYDTALRMLGAVTNPKLTSADHAIKKLADEIGRSDQFAPSRVGIYFGEDNKEGQPTPDPFFEGEGPTRRGCVQCGNCMTGCRYNAKNSLDKNYLFLAEKLGVDVRPETEVTDVRPAGLPDGSQGYFVSMKQHKGKTQELRASGVIFSGGVLGTVPLMMKLKRKGSLPRLSRMLGRDVRTNNESMASVTATGDNPGFDEGVTIGSILHTDENSHLEPINFGKKAGLWRMIVAPRTKGEGALHRFTGFVKEIVSDPVNVARAMFARDWPGRTVSLLFMQQLDSTLTLKLSRSGRLMSALEPGEQAPSANIPEADDLTDRMEKIVGGKAMRGFGEVLMGAPSTAHILGGAVIGKDESAGVINRDNRVFNYENMFVCDGSAVSANPGVNPSLTITALTEHAMSLVEDKASLGTPRLLEKPAEHMQVADVSKEISVAHA